MLQYGMVSVYFFKVWLWLVYVRHHCGMVYVFDSCKYGMVFADNIVWFLNCIIAMWDGMYLLCTKYESWFFLLFIFLSLPEVRLRIQKVNFFIFLLFKTYSFIFNSII